MEMAAVLCTSMLIPTVCVNAETSESDIKSAIEKAIEWKADKDSPFYGIGSYSSDFYIMALNRMGKNYDYSRYLAGLDGVAAGYGEEHNASSMQRTVLATIASGGDPRNVGGRDLVADGIYYRDNVSPLGKEGVNGYSWGYMYGIFFAFVGALLVLLRATGKADTKKKKGLAAIQWLAYIPKPIFDELMEL